MGDVGDREATRLTAPCQRLDDLPVVAEVEDGTAKSRMLGVYLLVQRYSARRFVWFRELGHVTTYAAARLRHELSTASPSIGMAVRWLGSTRGVA